MKKTSTRAAPARVPASPRPDFDVLLPTWPLLVERPGRPSINGSTINALSPDERERQHGDGHYAERRQLLHIVLDLLGHPSSTRRPPDLGAVFAAPTAGLIQALVGAYWQYYEKTHKEEFPLEHLEHSANPQEKPEQKMVTEPAVDGPLL